MTSEMADAATNVVAVVGTTERLRRSRLARLGAGRAGPAAAPTPTATVLPLRPDRAMALARDTGGSLLETEQRPIVMVEWREPLEACLDGLQDLPVPVDATRPLILFDLETTGLGTGTGTLPFLAGVGTWQGSDFVTRQLLLPDQSDEAGYLTALEHLIPPDACLVSYNGRTFDWPVLVARYRLHGRTPPVHAAHLDLLPLARTLWRHRLPDARLASVEQAVCGVRREHDLPGSLVPTRYLDYLRSGHGGLLREVLEHNRQDVVSMALLLRVLAQDLAPAAKGKQPPASVHPGDLGGLGRAYARKRRHVEALACFDLAMERLYDHREMQRYEGIGVDRARTLTRLGLREEAEGAWHAIAMEGGLSAALAWLHVAKHREHDERDFGAALRATDRARVLAERARLFGRRDRSVERDLSRRVPRLRRRLASSAV
ncbi:MAG: ribonuclease H-like domain-containing protein [Chloroflexota bacterium]